MLLNNVFYHQISLGNNGLIEVFFLVRHHRPYNMQVCISQREKKNAMCPKLASHRSLKNKTKHSTSYELMLCRTVGNSWSFLFLPWPPISILMISSILFYLTLPWIITYAPLGCLYLENVDDIKSDDDLHAKFSLPLTAIFQYMGTVGVSAFSDQSQCV